MYTVRSKLVVCIKYVLLRIKSILVVIYSSLICTHCSDKYCTVKINVLKYLAAINNITGTITVDALKLYGVRSEAF